MPLPVPHDQKDARQGNGMKKAKKGKKKQKQPKGLPKSNVFDMFGERPARFATEPLLPSPNSNNFGTPAF